MYCLQSYLTCILDLHRDFSLYSVSSPTSLAVFLSAIIKVGGQWLGQ